MGGKSTSEIETEDKFNGLIEYKDIVWTKKEFKDLFRKGER